MINHPAFTVEPWCLRATELDRTVLAQSESVFALANGHIGWRRLLVDIRATTVTYALREGEPLQISHHGQLITVPSNEPIHCAIPTRRPASPTLRQPPGCRPGTPRPDEALRCTPGRVAPIERLRTREIGF